MKKKHKSVGQIEKFSTKEYAEYAVSPPDKKAQSLIARLRTAVMNVFTDDEPILYLGEEEKNKLLQIMAKCDEKLKDIYNNANVPTTKPFFDRIGQANKMEEDYMTYQDVSHFMKYNFKADLSLWTAFEDYLNKLADSSNAEKNFVDAKYLISAVNNFTSNPGICSEVLMLIFKGNSDKARAILDCPYIPALNSQLGTRIITKLLEQNTSTIDMFLYLIQQIPKKFINNMDRADLLIVYAIGHVHQEENAMGQDAVEYILKKEKSVNPYR